MNRVTIAQNETNPLRQHFVKMSKSSDEQAV